MNGTGTEKTRLVNDTFKSIDDTDSDTQKIAAIQFRRYFIGHINHPEFNRKFVKT